MRGMCVPCGERGSKRSHRARASLCKTMISNLKKKGIIEVCRAVDINIICSDFVMFVVCVNFFKICNLLQFHLYHSKEITVFVPNIVMIIF